MSWRETTLDEFVKRKEVDIQTGPFGTQLKASDYTEVGTPVINVRNIGYGELRPEKLEFVPEVVLSRLSKHQLQHRDIVFGRKGAVDRHLYVEDDYAGWMQGSDCIRLRVHTDELSPKFVSYFLLRESHKQWMLNQCSNKATMASLNQDVICRIPLKLPPIGTQKAIADILSAYDALIENNRRRMALLEESARLLYREWFVHLRFPGHEHVPITDGVPEGWERVRLKDLTTKIGSGATPKGGEGAYKDEGITLIRSLNVYDYRFDESGLAFIDDTQASKLANVVVEPNDVLLNITGASVGRCCMVQDRHLPARVNQHVMIIRAAPDLIGPHFLLHAINSYQNKERLLSIARAGGATREALTKDVVSEFQIVLPPGRLRKKFEDVARDSNSQVQKLSAQNTLLAQARDLLLPRLMNGELTV